MSELTKTLISDPGLPQAAQQVVQIAPASHRQAKRFKGWAYSTSFTRPLLASTDFISGTIWRGIPTNILPDD